MIQLACGVAILGTHTRLTYLETSATISAALGTARGLLHLTGCQRRGVYERSESDGRVIFCVDCSRQKQESCKELLEVLMFCWNGW